MREPLDSPGASPPMIDDLARADLSRPEISKPDIARADIGPAASDRLSPFEAREIDEAPCPYRTPFQRDRDRIIHAKAFRRLAHKTQVFIASAGDHFRTRLTHTLEVAQIARTLARALNLNEDLAEAISLGHDLGHTPFGHAGERVLNELSPQGFHHQSQSLRVVKRLAREGRGLNLTLAVLDGIGKHSKGRGPVFIDGPGRPLTGEGQLVRAADIIAYLAHDLDDAFEAGLLSPSDMPGSLIRVFGSRASTRRGVMVGDLLANTVRSGQELTLAFSPSMAEAMEELRTFLFQRVYHRPELSSQLEIGQSLIRLIYRSLMEDDRLFESITKDPAAESREAAVCDFISGMTDRFAFSYAESLKKGLKPAELSVLA
jgi:dGTPase